MHPIVVGILVLASVALALCLTGMCCRKQSKPQALLEPPDHKVA